MAGKTDDLPPECPHCDTALKPERLGAGRYVCECCSRIFIDPPPKKS